MATEDFSGPIDYLVFGFPASADPGAGLREVLARVDSGQIELLDIEIIGRGADGEATAGPLTGSSVHDETLAARFEGAYSGILDDADRADVLAELAPGDIAIVVVYEDRSLAHAADAWLAVGGRELFAGGVDLADLENALQEGDIA